MILIKNGTVLTMAGRVIENGCVLVEDSKIKYVGEEKDFEGVSEIIDAEGGYIMPGMIDAHCHLGLWEDGVGFEGADGNEATDPITPHLRAIDGINPMDRTFKEAYENGITCVCTGPGSANVIAGSFAVIKTYGKRIDNMIIKNPAAIKVAFGENPKSTYHEKHEMPTTRMGIAALLRETLYKAQEYMNKKENAEEDDDKPDFDMKYESLIPVLKREIPLKVHAHRADDMFTAIRIAKEFNLDLTLDHCTEGHLIADELKEEGYPLIVGPSLSERSKVELRELTFETAGILSKKGIDIAIMTDHGVIPIQYLPLCAALAVKHGMDEMEALKAITINPAKILKIDDRVGSLEVGKDADIVVLDKFPLDVMAKTKYVLIDGKVVFRR
ncbi:amidohydrolase [Thermobrachium celere]|uniref:Amidohydrolase n=1 Tax=Thermobrachium celere DSM 8682 TaxID=941824 RepID=R7RQ86_9CLOT|nr:amidohydrolase [Thermobrachium celere]GFR35898.1 hydrolase [Thermobrachium celere]CDF57501.1 amidohydrolase [Thermobrachium celere DSM 8682]